MKVAACIVGIDNWDKYTRPLIESIRINEPACAIVVIDNASEPAYPEVPGVKMQHTERLCYAAALNTAAKLAGDADWYIFIANDILCTAPFINLLKSVPPGYMVGLGVYQIIHYRYVSGYCMVIPRHIWKTVGEFDEQYLLSAWEDTDYSYRVQLKGFRLMGVADFPFLHLDQQQRQGMTDIGRLHSYNGAYFERKHNIPLPLRRYSANPLVRDMYA